MRFNKEFLSRFSPTTAKLLERADKISDANVDKIARTNAWIKATDNAYANEEWLAYLGGIYFAMWSMQCCEGKYVKKLIEYSNNFIRFGKEHFPEALASSGQYSDWAGRVYLNNYLYIYDFYREYYQISDEKITELFEIYHREFLDHPAGNTEYYYMYSKLRYSINIRDKKQANTYLRRIVALERSTRACYVCHNMEIIGAMLLVGRVDEALYRIAQIISDEGIPESWYDDYRSCENADARAQYGAIIRHAFWLRMPDMLRKFSEDYKNEILFGNQTTANLGFDFMVLAITRETNVRSEFFLSELTRGFNTIKELTPYCQLQFLLSAWAYLEMLHESGIKTVMLSINNPLIQVTNDEYNTHNLAEYCLKKADTLGAKFDNSRPSFKYESLRKTAFSMLNRVKEKK